MLKNEKKYQDEKIENLQADLKIYVRENTKLKKKLTELEYVHNKDLGELKVVQEMKHISFVN